MFVLMALASVATAQSPTPSAALSAPPAADTQRWLVADTPSVRFVGEAIPGPTFTAGEQVAVLVEAEGKVRVFARDKFGWVAPSALTTVGPPPPSLPGGMPTGLGGSPLLGGLQAPSLPVMPTPKLP